jgi:hypothetical protein
MADPAISSMYSIPTWMIASEANWYATRLGRIGAGFVGLGLDRVAAAGWSSLTALRRVESLPFGGSSNLLKPGPYTRGPVGGCGLTGCFGFAQGQDDGKNRKQRQRPMQVLRLRALRFAQDDRFFGDGRRTGNGKANAGPSAALRMTDFLVGWWVGGLEVWCLRVVAERVVGSWWVWVSRGPSPSAALRVRMTARTKSKGNGRCRSFDYA